MHREAGESADRGAGPAIHSAHQECLRGVLVDGNRFSKNHPGVQAGTPPAQVHRHAGTLRPQLCALVRADPPRH